MFVYICAIVVSLISLYFLFKYSLFNDAFVLKETAIYWVPLISIITVVFLLIIARSVFRLLGVGL